MERIDFVELGQSFAVNCEKLKRGGERWEPGTTGLSFPNCARRDWIVRTWQSRVSREEKQPVWKAFIFLPGGWGSEEFCCARSMPLLWTVFLRQKKINAFSQTAQRGVEMWGSCLSTASSQLLTSSLGKVVSFCSWESLQVTKAQVWLCAHWPSQGFL